MKPKGQKKARLVAVALRMNPNDDRGVCEVAFFDGEPTQEQLHKAAERADGDKVETFERYDTNETDNPKLTAFVVAW